MTLHMPGIGGTITSVLFHGRWHDLRPQHQNQLSTGYDADQAIVRMMLTNY